MNHIVPVPCSTTLPHQLHHHRQLRACEHVHKHVTHTCMYASTHICTLLIRRNHDITQCSNFQEWSTSVSSCSRLSNDTSICLLWLCAVGTTNIWYLTICSHLQLHAIKVLQYIFTVLEVDGVPFDTFYIRWSNNGVKVKRVQKSESWVFQTSTARNHS